MKDERPIKEIVKDLEKRLGCNCDLDSWEPEQSTGHSHVCRIHKIAKAYVRGDFQMIDEGFEQRCRVFLGEPDCRFLGKA